MKSLLTLDRLLTPLAGTAALIALGFTYGVAVELAALAVYCLLLDIRNAVDRK